MPQTKIADKKYLLALAAFPKFGPSRLAKIKSSFPDWQSGFRASTRELTAAGLAETQPEAR